MDLIGRLQENRENHPKQHILSEASFIVETVLQNPEDQLLDAKQYIWHFSPDIPWASQKPGNWLQKYVSDLRNCLEPGCTTCGGYFWFWVGLTARIAEIVGPAGPGEGGLKLNTDGAKLLVDLMREWKPHPSWRWKKASLESPNADADPPVHSVVWGSGKGEKAMQLMIRSCWGVLGKPIVQDRLGQSWAGLVAGRMSPPGIRGS
jgi:hypothetical protein